MRALIAGGMTATYDPAVSRISVEHNPYGCFEPNVEQGIEKGKVRKVMYSELKGLKREDSGKVLFLTRNFENMQRSQFIALNTISCLCQSLNEYHKHTMRALEELGRCPKMDVMVLNADWLMNSPKEVFEVIKDRGWPIDPDKAVTGIDRSLWSQ